MFQSTERSDWFQSVKRSVRFQSVELGDWFQSIGRSVRFQSVGRCVQIALVIGIATLVVGAAAAGPVAAADEPTPSLVVELDEEGDAEMTLTLAFDLEGDEEHDAFQTLRNDAEAREDARDRFADRMAAVAADVESDREMDVTDASIELWTSADGDVGVVELQVTWTNLAAVEDGTLVVTEPFASGFEPDQPFTVQGPDGYEVVEPTPDPDSSNDTAASWTAGSDLSGFEVAFATPDQTPTPTEADPDPEDSADDADESAPGFGSGAAFVGLLVLAAGLTRRR